MSQVLITSCSLRYLPIRSVPHPYGGVQSAAGDALAVESDRVDLVEVPAQNVQARARVHVPDAAGAVITPANDPVAAHVETAHALRVALEHAEETPALDVPHAHGPIARA